VENQIASSKQEKESDVMAITPSTNKDKDWTQEDHDHDWYLKTQEAPEPVNNPFFEMIE